MEENRWPREAARGTVCEAMDDDVWNTRVAQHYDEAFAPAFAPEVLEPTSAS